MKEISLLQRVVENQRGLLKRKPSEAQAQLSREIIELAEADLVQLTIEKLQLETAIRMRDGILL